MKRILAGLALVIALPILIFAQTKPAAGATAPTGPVLKLVFVDGDKLDVQTPDGKTLALNVGIYEGDSIPVGATILTGPTTTAELQLVPNKTIIKLAKNTTFKVEGLATTGQEKNTFALAAGKIRAVAAKGAQYDFKGQTAVCGVRGTDFSFAIEGGQELLAVTRGLIAFQKFGGAAESVDVGAGMAADALASTFSAFAFSSDQFASLFGDMGFKKLLESDVPETDAAAQASQPTQVETTPVTSQEAASTLAEGASKLDKSDVQSGLMKWLGEVMGLELGSVSIDKTTYAKVVVQPSFVLGKVKMGLYLPVIYKSDLFNPSDWYAPNGNNEWSFGTDKGWKAHPLDAGLDALSDLALKIKYFEYGKQFDPFFVKVGNLDDLTLGHGLIMRNYANDTEFPAIRRVGFDLGVDSTGTGFEAIVNDLAAPEIFAGRVYFRPIPDSKLAVGFSGVADIAPFSGTNAENAGFDAADYNDPILLGAGVDFDLPIVQSSFFGLRFFADAAAETEYTQADSKLHYELIYNSDTGAVSNWGAAGGFIGNVAFIDWRLEYRYFTGIFQPSLFDSTYNRNRADIAVKYNTYINGPSSAFADLSPTMGIYGEGSFGFLKSPRTGEYKLSFSLGYMWPWIPGKTMQYQLDNAHDEFHAKIVVLKGLLPIFDVHGSIFYDKHDLVQSIANGDFKFLDGNTTFGGELVVPVPKTPNLEVAAVFAAVPTSMNSDGTTNLSPSVTLETRFHF